MESGSIGNGQDGKKAEGVEKQEKYTFYTYFYGIIKLPKFFFSIDL